MQFMKHCILQTESHPDFIEIIDKVEFYNACLVTIFLIFLVSVN